MRKSSARSAGQKQTQPPERDNDKRELCGAWFVGLLRAVLQTGVRKVFREQLDEVERVYVNFLHSTDLLISKNKHSSYFHAYFI